MPLDVYRLDCPRCGQVEGYSETEVANTDFAVDAESLIEEQEFSSPSGPVSKCRCPQCGTWVSASNVEPT
jgi:predicted RNA-binding Zn-ribbon protein involved in translation (DUF1610 family)